MLRFCAVPRVGYQIAELMAHIGVVCPNVPGHLNPTIALADALRSRGHRLTFFLLGDPPAPVLAPGFEVIEMGGSTFPPDY
jgi:UDP:flavonoid glycosyltransferase YjiC (YdhE family)